MDSSHVDESDEVVAEYDVYVAQQLHDVRVFQYPLRHSSRPYEHNGIKLYRAHHDPSIGDRYLMKLSLEKRARESFDETESGGGAEMALHPIGASGAQYSRPFQYQLEASPVVHHGNYAIGYFSEGALHLTAVKTLHQFFPNVHSPYEEDTRAHESKVVCSEEEASALSAHIDKQLKRLRSVSLRSDADSLENIEYYPETTVEAKTVTQRLLCPTQTIVRLSATNTTETIFPIDTTEDVNTQDLKVPMRFSHSRPIDEQVHALVMSAQVVTFTELHSRVRTASGPLTPEALITTLATCTYFIADRFVSTANPKFTGASNVIRDYVLLMFHQGNGRFEKSSILSRWPARVRVRVVDEVLATIAVFVPALRCWELKEPADDFSARFAFDAGKLNSVWERRGQEIKAAFEHLRNTGVAATHGSPSPANRLRSVSSPVIGKTPGVSNPRQRDEQIAAARRYTRALFLHHGVINRELAKDVLRAATRTPGSPIHDIASDVLQEVAQQELTSLKDNAWILRTIDAATDKYRKHMIAFLRKNTSFMKSDAVKAVASGLTEEGGAPVAEADIPASILTKLLAEFAVYQQGERLWHVKSGVVSVQQVVATLR